MTKASSSKGGGSSDVNAAGNKVVQKPISTFFRPVEPVANGTSPGPSDRHHSKKNGTGRSPAPLQAERDLDLDAPAKPSKASKGQSSASSGGAKVKIPTAGKSSDLSTYVIETRSLLTVAWCHRGVDFCSESRWIWLEESDPRDDPTGFT
jgi:hypothetical protein